MSSYNMYVYICITRHLNPFCCLHVVEVDFIYEIIKMKKS